MGRDDYIAKHTVSNKNGNRESGALGHTTVL